MNLRLIALVLPFVYQTNVLAAEAAVTTSPTGSILKMVLGLAVVLIVMGLISWAAKRMLPNAVSQNSAVKVVGGVSVGSRERVVVLEVANRWLVVGVAQGQVSAIANLDIDSDTLTAAINAGNTSNTAAMHPIAKPFSEWLKKSADNAKAKLAKRNK